MACVPSTLVCTSQIFDIATIAQAESWLSSLHWIPSFRLPVYKPVKPAVKHERVDGTLHTVLLQQNRLDISVVATCQLESKSIYLTEKLQQRNTELTNR